MHRRLLAALGLAVTVAGCSSPPAADIRLAQDNLDKAIAAGAPKYAAAAMRAATDAKTALDAEITLQESRWIKSYDKTEDLAVAAQAAADKAAADAEAVKQRTLALATEGTDRVQTGPNLLANGDFSDGIAGWGRIHTAGIDIRIEPGRKDAVAELRIRVAVGAQHVVLLQGITMKPNTPYIYEMEVKSTGQVVALYWESDVGRFNAERSFPEWTRLHSVFMTPRWNGHPMKADFHPVLAKGVGDIAIRNVRLLEVTPKVD